MGRQVLAVLLSFVFCSAAFPAQAPSTCVVLQSQLANLNKIDATVGTTVYDGDRLETQSKGVLSVRTNQILLSLPENSVLWMNHQNTIAIPNLQAGTVVFRTDTGDGVEIHADDVRVRPHSLVLTVGEVTIEKCDVLVTARTQPLDVTAGKETKVLEEGKSYRVTRLGACGAFDQGSPNSPIRFSYWHFVPAIPILICAIHEAAESPDRPGSWDPCF